jgi:hypothetical protein
MRGARAPWAVAVLAAGALGPAGCGEYAYTDAGARARADSSAAGLAVGPAVVASGAPDDSVRDTMVVAARGGAGAPKADSAATPDSARGAPPEKQDTVERPTPQHPIAAPRADSTPPRRPPRRPPPAPRTTVNAYLEFTPSERAAYLDLVAAYDSARGRPTFNGAAEGAATATIPLGWRVVIHFANADTVPHSAIVVDEPDLIPDDAPAAAFAQAFVRRVEDGLPPGARDDIAFIANREGRFLIFCGVPGHGVQGQWIRLLVSSQAAVPLYTP